MISNFREAKGLSNLRTKAKVWKESELPSFSAKSEEGYNQSVMEALPASVCTASLPEQKTAPTN